ncbi:hypothetical protein EMIT0180MI3_12286 [Priestia megaterium]
MLKNSLIYGNDRYPFLYCSQTLCRFCEDEGNWVRKIPVPKKGLRMKHLPQGKSIKIKGGKKHAKNTLCSILTLTCS